MTLHLLSSVIPFAQVRFFPCVDRIYAHAVGSIPSHLLQTCEVVVSADVAEDWEPFSRLDADAFISTGMGPHVGVTELQISLTILKEKLSGS